ncbi:CRISPR-associated protein [Candidatus Filomicrobium marinum]|uniref:CRISPR-associated protein n=1 Tax=Candidatus Filomicrobium marinum TaxID=1608628 RepID=A0A0D6JK96_9HYPH|nr:MULTISPECIES: type I-E CRISPR-associated protein Cas6/Cse3/CasE [Filomicrobium]MCV0371796.1 type I-E CRISPR-associated protein Cas6/Cse3/CasE [Filomicrobium sp.]CFX29933.1 CRISPR-associated protein [Candidatus Filomicrobium marinum]CPR22117.1 CRISPR-associated protein [Candidatus Filomicrobium marinum]
MSSPLHFARVPIRLSALARYAGDRDWIPRKRRDGREADAGFDPGRALHHVLDETFGPNALKPFRLMVPRHKDLGTIYAYTAWPKDELLAIAAETAVPEFAADHILRLVDLDTKPMPETWTEGKRLAFDVRVRPVSRIRTELPNPNPKRPAYKPGSEVDVFLLEAQRNHPDGRTRLVDGTPTASGMMIAGRDRPTVYRDWLAARLDGAAEVDHEHTDLTAFQRSRVSRGGASVEGPDATFHGELSVTDPERFHALLARGIGRHLSFGFGMLLLRPPRRR